MVMLRTNISQQITKPGNKKIKRTRRLGCNTNFMEVKYPMTEINLFNRSMIKEETNGTKN